MMSVCADSFTHIFLSFPTPIIILLPFILLFCILPPTSSSPDHLSSHHSYPSQPSHSSHPSSPEFSLRYELTEEQPDHTPVGNILFDLGLDLKYNQTTLDDLRFTFLSPSSPHSQLFSVDDRTGVIRTRGRVDREAICPGGERGGVWSEHSSGTGGLGFQPMGRRVGKYSLDRDLSRIKLTSLSNSGKENQGDVARIGFQVRGWKEAEIRSTDEVSLEGGIDMRQESGSEVRSHSQTGVGVRMIPKSGSAADCTIRLDIAMHPIQFFHILKIRIEILDVNDNSPVFPVQKVTEVISEAAELGAGFILPTATDADCSLNGVRVYQFHPPLRQFQLKVHRMADGGTELKAVLASELDREETKSYDTMLYAIDGGTAPKTGSLAIRILVADVNDNRPEFTSAVYEVRVPENAPLSGALVTVKAVDKDEGVNAKVVYSLSTRDTSNPSLPLFGVGQDSGVVYLLRPLDYETSRLHALTVTASDQGATDHGSGDAYTSVIVHVVDVNDNVPRLTLSTLTRNSLTQDSLTQTSQTQNSLQQSALISTTGRATIRENLPPGSFVAHLSIADGDYQEGEGGESLEEGGGKDGRGEDGKRDVDGDNGRVDCWVEEQGFNLEGVAEFEFSLVTSQSLDREVQAVYDVTVVCADRGKPSLSSSADLTVIVSDENDNDPQFLQATYHKLITYDDLHNLPRSGDMLLQVLATDEDAGQNGHVRYRLDDQVTHALLIDPDTGDITFKMNLTLWSRSATGQEVADPSDAGKAAHHIDGVGEVGAVLTRLAFEELGKESVSDGKVTIVEKTGPERPGVKHRKSGTLSERPLEDNPEKSVKKLSAVWREKIVESKCQRDIKKLDTLRRKWDPNMEDLLLQFFVYADDYGTPQRSGCASVEIRFRHVPQHPRFSREQFRFVVPENSPVGTPVGSIVMPMPFSNEISSIRSVSLGSRLSSPLSSPGDDPLSSPNHASIGGLSSTPSQTLPRLPLSRQGHPSRNIQDSNIICSYSLAPLFSANRTHSAPISWGTGGHGDPFGIDPISGVISTRGGLDRERQATYRMVGVVRCTGGAWELPTTGGSDLGAGGIETAVTHPGSATTVVVVRISDVNDNKPVFSFPSPIYNRVDVSSNAPIGTTVATFEAHDPDLDARMTFSIHDFSGAWGAEKSSHISEAPGGKVGPNPTPFHVVFFSVDSRTGALTVSSDLSDAKSDRIVLRAVVTDVDDPRLSDSAELQVVLVRGGGRKEMGVGGEKHDGNVGGGGTSIGTGGGDREGRGTGSVPHLALQLSVLANENLLVALVICLALVLVIIVVMLLLLCKVRERVGRCGGKGRGVGRGCGEEGEGGGGDGRQVSRRTAEVIMLSSNHITSGKIHLKNSETKCLSNTSKVLERPERTAQKRNNLDR